MDSQPEKRRPGESASYFSPQLYLRHCPCPVPTCNLNNRKGDPSWRGSGGLGFIDGRRGSRGFPELMTIPWPLSDPIGVPLLGLSCRSHSRTVSRPDAVFLMSRLYLASQAHPWRAGRRGIRWSQFVWSMGPSSAAHYVEHAQPAGIQEASWPPVGTASEPGTLTPSTCDFLEAFSCSA